MCYLTEANSIYHIEKLCGTNIYQWYTKNNVDIQMFMNPIERNQRTSWLTDILRNLLIQQTHLSKMHPLSVRKSYEKAKCLPDGSKLNWKINYYIFSANNSSNWSLGGRLDVIWEEIGLLTKSGSPEEGINNSKVSHLLVKWWRIAGCWTGKGLRISGTKGHEWWGKPTFYISEK